MTCTNCYTSCCPEPISPTINQTIVQIGEGTLLSKTEGTTLSGSTWTLQDPPYNPAGMLLVVGGIPQQFGRDFSIGAAGIIRFLTESPDGEYAFATYDYLTDAAAVTVESSGSAKTLMVDPSSMTSDDLRNLALSMGYLLLDGGPTGTGYLITSYQSASDVVGTSLNTATCPVLNFADEAFSNAIESNGVLVSFFMILKI